MPLSSGTSNKSRQENVEREVAAGKPIKQAVAIGYAKQRENIAKGSHAKDAGGIKRLVGDLCGIIRRF